MVVAVVGAARKDKGSNSPNNLERKTLPDSGEQDLQIIWTLSKLSIEKNIRYITKGDKNGLFEARKTIQK